MHDPFDSFTSAELLRALSEAIASLPARERIVLSQHYLDGSTYGVIARRLGVSEWWAKQLGARAVKKMRDRMEEWK